MKSKIFVNNDTIDSIVKFEIKKLGDNADLNHIDVSGVTNMDFLFCNTNFNGDISKWDVSNVESMNNTFSYSKFNGDISNWDVSKVKSMRYTFNNSEFNGDINVWFYDFIYIKKHTKDFNISTTGNYTLLEKYVKAIEENQWFLADKIAFKANVLRFKKHYPD